MMLYTMLFTMGLPYNALPYNALLIWSEGTMLQPGVCATHAEGCI